MHQLIVGFPPSAGGRALLTPSAIVELIRISHATQFVVTWPLPTAYPGRIHAERDKTEADYELYWEVDVRASIAYAATNIRNRGGDVTFDAYHYIDRVEGHQLQITNEDQSRTYAAIYLHDSKLYVVEATVAPGSIPPGFFQQSLQWIKEDGSRVRYQNYTDAVKVRNPDIRD